MRQVSTFQNKSFPALISIRKVNLFWQEECYCDVRHRSLKGIKLTNVQVIGWNKHPADGLPQEVYFSLNTDPPKRELIIPSFHWVRSGFSRSKQFAPNTVLIGIANPVTTNLLIPELEIKNLEIIFRD
jgi:hypothetical protein